MTSKTKSRLVAAAIIAVILGIAAVILIVQPASVKADDAKRSTASSSAAPAGNESSGSAASALPNISAVNPGQLNSGPAIAVAPDQSSPGDLPTVGSSTEPYKQEAEKAGAAFLKIYYNAPGFSMANPQSYLEQLAPYGSKKFLAELRGTSPATEWSPFGQFMHDKKLDYSVEAACSLAPGQSLAPVFDEKDGGNLPCTFIQTVVGQDGLIYSGSDLGVHPKSNGSQSLKMIKENGSWKVAAFDSYGQ